MSSRRSHSKIKKLPKPLLEQINNAIARRGLTYDDLESLVQQWVDSGELHPDEAPSRSALGRHGKNFLARLEQLSMMREQAKTIVTEAAGDGLVMEEAAASLVINEIMSILMAVDKDKGEGMSPADVARIANGLGKLQSSSVQREKLKSDFAKRVKEATKKVAKVAKKAGLSKSTIAKIEREVLGIAQ